MLVNKTKTEMRCFKIIVIGDSGVGKTCLTYRFCSGKFPLKTDVTIGVDFREKTLLVDTETIKLQLWDTAGQDRFRKSMISHYYRGGQAVVFVYDVTSLKSFESLPLWIQECDKHNLSSQIPRLIVGNKVDQGVVRVPTQIAQQFADSHNMPVFETSALDDSLADHVESIFMTIAYKLKASKPMMVGGGLSRGDEGGGGGSTPAPQETPQSIVLHRADVISVPMDEGAATPPQSNCLC